MNRRHILLVDDTSYDRILYKEYLGDTEYAFTELDDGYDIIRSLEGSLPEVILLDWQLPKLGGLETLKILKGNRIYKNIPIIVITGLQDENVLRDAYNYDCFDFIQKPVSKIELNCRINNAFKLIEANKLLRQQKLQLENLNSTIIEQNSHLKQNIALQKDTKNLQTQELEKRNVEIENQLVEHNIKYQKIKNQLSTVNTIIDKVVKENKELGALSKDLNNLQKKCKSLIMEIKVDNNFQKLYRKIEPAFFDTLIAINPQLSPLDLKHCAFIKLNLDNFEIAEILNVETKSLQMSRYRLKAKLNVPKKINLREFIVKI